MWEEEPIEEVKNCNYLDFIQSENNSENKYSKTQMAKAIALMGKV